VHFTYSTIQSEYAKRDYLIPDYQIQLNNHKHRNQNEFDFSDFVPEQQHCSVGSKRSKQSNQQKLGFWDSPAFMYAFEFVNSEKG
jgi:hypothetical protein